MRELIAQTHDLLLKGGAAVAGFFHGMTTGDNRSAVLLVALMAADVVSGTVAAALGKSRKTGGGRLDSAAAGKGLLRKGLMLLVVLLAYVLDWMMNEENRMFSTAAIWFYIGTEGLSLLENLALCGVPVPAKIRRMLEKASQEEENEKPPASQG